MENITKNGNFVCYFCGHELIWDSSADIGDITGDYEDEEGVVNFYHCSHCGRGYEIYDPSKEERETEYKEYWQEKNKVKKYGKQVF